MLLASGPLTGTKLWREGAPVTGPADTWAKAGGGGGGAPAVGGRAGEGASVGEPRGGGGRGSETTGPVEGEAGVAGSGGAGAGGELVEEAGLSGTATFGGGAISTSSADAHSGSVSSAMKD